MKKLLILSALFLCCCSGPQIKNVSQEIAVQHESISYSSDLTKKVEFYWAKPTGDGPWPVILYIHGFQPGEKTVGGRDLADFGVLKAKAEKGIVAVSMSQPGFGQSDGPRDYCGPNTQKSALGVLNEIRKWSFVNKKKIALYGVSRGAIVASMIEAQDPDIAAAILVVGIYDLGSSYNLMKRSKSEEIKSIAENMKTEAGIKKEDFLSRSALFHVVKIKTPTLILNVGQDERSGQISAQKFAKALKKQNVPVKYVEFPQYEHFIPIKERDKEIEPFLQTYLF